MCNVDGVTILFCKVSCRKKYQNLLQNDDGVISVCIVKVESKTQALSKNICEILLKKTWGHIVEWVTFIFKIKIQIGQ